MSKKRAISKLIILVGLPGSGKTTWAKSKSSYRIIDFDEIAKRLRCKRAEGKNIFDMAMESGLGYMLFTTKPHSKEIVVLDGLFTRQSEYELAIEKYYEVFDFDKVEFHYWIPNVDACLWNDRGRRSQSSEATIKALKVERPDVKVLKEKFDMSVTIVEHSVQRKPAYAVIAEENGLRLYGDKYFRSCSWSNGGVAWNYDGEKYPIEAETPLDFAELDDFLMEVSPELTFLQYKKIQRECVTLETENNCDYYSETTSSFYVCDMETLFDLLQTWGYIPEQS